MTEGASPTRPWWQEGVIYQIYPRSFADTDGDGIGDLQGVLRHLDHLTWLGVDAVWLSPIYRSPMADFGYDVSDHCDVDPTFGGLADLDQLLAACHGSGVKLMLDWVPNHTSDQHPWFVASRSSRSDPHRSWYVWRDGRDGAEPNNWPGAFGGRAWTYDDATGQWYLHLFLPEQPDLNWSEPAVVDAMHGVLRFWLDRGIDGFRADVVHMIGKDPALADLPPEHAGESPVGTLSLAGTHPLLRGIRRLLDSYPGDRVMVGEVNLATPELVAPFYGRNDELNLVFNFSLLRARFDAARWGALMESAEAALAVDGAWPVWVLGNHDVRRLRSRYGGSEERARVAATLLLTARGTPFLYAGDELGLLDAEVPPDRVVDPGGRDGCRAPLPWTAEGRHGWAAEPWLPWPPEAAERSAEAQSADPDSILHLHRRLLAARRRSPALRRGTWRRIDGPDSVLAYERIDGGDGRRVLANFSDEPVEVGGHDGWRVEVATHLADEDRLFTGSLAPVQAVLLAPGAAYAASGS